MSFFSPEELQRYLQHAELYRLGDLMTEQQHPLTTQLSTWAETDLSKAFSAFCEIDQRMLQTVLDNASDIQQMATQVHQVLQSGGRVFLSGCGSTGRMALALEAFWRQWTPPPYHPDQVVGFMAGGDIALVRPFESVEDSKSEGAAHLRALGFCAEDILLASTEGGETTYVIGTAEEATQVSKYSTWFLFCNPEELLRKTVKRSDEVLSLPQIRSISLSVGPMVLSGSTRMQATSALMAALVLSLFYPKNFAQGVAELTRLKSLIQDNPFSKLHDLIEHEAQIYQQRRHVLYCTQSAPVSVLTDTAERSPTFSMLPFERMRMPLEARSLCYLFVNSANALAAWQKILRRDPRIIAGKPQVKSSYGIEEFSYFDFSEQGLAWRKAYELGQSQEFAARLQIEFEMGMLYWKFYAGEDIVCSQSWDASQLEPVWQQLLLKMLLNAHSTLLMGRLHRYDYNVMTWVKPSNGKLIDRATRYCLYLLKLQGLPLPTYETAVRALFEVGRQIKSDESIVLKTMEHLQAKMR